jgi:hypothetical protein
VETSGFIQEVKTTPLAVVLETITNEFVVSQEDFDAAVEAEVQKRIAKVVIEAPMGNIRPTEYLVANQHTAPIMMPRSAPGGIFMPPLILPPGQITRIDAEEWELRKTIPSVQYYLDKQLLQEVGRLGGQVPMSDTTSDLVVPAHLSTEEHQGKEAPANARVTKTAASTVEVP